jgi:hypothetical protein
VSEHQTRQLIETATNHHPTNLTEPVQSTVETCPLIELVQQPAKTSRKLHHGQYTGVRERIKKWQERIEGDRDMEKSYATTFGLTMPVIEPIKDKNKCKVEHELQQVLVEENKADISDYKDYMSLLKEKTNLVSDFRKMPSVQSLSELKMQGKRMKRLQDGPKESSRKLQLDQKTGIALRRIITQIIEANPRITLGGEGRRKYAKRMETKGMELESGEYDENCGDAAQPGGATSGPRGAVACLA